MRGAAIEDLQNPRTDTVPVLHDLVVPEAQNPESLTGEKSRADFITFGVCVLPAIDLDDERMREANEVHDITADRLLSTKLGSSQLAAAEEVPHHFLGVRHIAAETTSDRGGQDSTPHPPVAARRAPPSPTRGEGMQGASSNCLGQNDKGAKSIRPQMLVEKVARKSTRLLGRSGIVAIDVALWLPKLSAAQLREIEGMRRTGKHDNRDRFALRRQYLTFAGAK